MEVISLQDKYAQPLVLCLGFFDCMHKGHTLLLQQAKQIAVLQGAKVGLFTFRNNHFKTLNRPTKLLYTFDERLYLYESLGVDVVVYGNFDKQFMSSCGGDFLRLVARFNLKGVVCGADYTCGSDLMSAMQVKEFLKDVCLVEVVSLVTQDGEKVCSSLVRKLLLQGDVQKANTFLSQPFFFLGKVTHGRNVGEKIGFPTVNIPLEQDKIVPFGVYGGKVSWQGGEAKAIVNVGTKPTFGCKDANVEAHLLNFDGSLYGERVKISLNRFLRQIQKFADADELQHQLQKDVEAVEND